MVEQKQTISLDRHGVDEAAGFIEEWLNASKVKHTDVLRVRLTMESLLSTLITPEGEPGQAELRFSRWMGACWLRVRYGGERFDPTVPAANEFEALSRFILNHTGFLPDWRWANGRNELRLRIPTGGIRPEFVTLGCIAAALAVGLLGGVIPDAVKAGVTDYVLRFLADGFWNLLNTFIGLMIFFSIVTGICGFGSASVFGRVGNLMLTRFVSLSFLICGLLTAASALIFRLPGGSMSCGGQVRSILELVFHILPGNPIRPFLEGNTLQIVFLGVMVGVMLLLLGSEAEAVRTLAVQLQTLIMRCISFVSLLLPVFVFCSLVMQIWRYGAGIFLRLWKPLVAGAVLSLGVIAVYAVIVCRKMRVKPSVLLPKLLPDYLIAFSTGSSAAAFSTSLEINETKLGMDPAFSKTALSIGGMLFAGVQTLNYLMCALYLAEYYGVSADVTWWVVLWLTCTLLIMATPPVSGGGIACMSILLAYLGIPEEGLAMGAAVTVLMDFICTGARVTTLHLEMLLQANRLDLLDRETLRKKM